MEAEEIVATSDVTPGVPGTQSTCEEEASVTQTLPSDVEDGDASATDADPIVSNSAVAIPPINPLAVRDISTPF
ncbi:hypothetical protein [Nonomuraea jiangxiensis]|uniref:hypothetical protein n=1 Tax=Nonomuraea jiangxiensis TaxID=633440 RepID=UPI00115F8692|nr:hypothetical protein [Nonomuraea jiangxiensis]